LNSSGTPQGAVLESGAVTVAITPGQVNNVNLTMGGAAARAAITSLNSQPLNGAPSDLNFRVNIMDADGFTIVSPGLYSSPFGAGAPEPVTFVVTEFPFSDSFRFSVNSVNQVFADQAQLNSPADTYTLQYAGRGVISATINVETLNHSLPLATATISPQAAYLPVAGAPAVDASAVVQGAADGATVWFTEPSRAKIAFVRFGTLREISIPSGNTPTLLVPAGVPGRQEFVYATAQGTIGFVIDDGTINEFTTPSHSTIGGIHFNSGIFTAYFTETAAGKIGKLGLGGSLQEITLATGEHPTAMDPIIGDFVDPATNSIGFIDADDHVTERALPAANSQPNGIAVGPQGSEWVTEGGGKRIARLNPDGSLVEFPTQDVLTSIAVVKGDSGPPFVAATDVSGNIELFNLDGTETTYNPGASGPATNVGEAYNHDVLYVCGSCSGGIRDFLY
jgi:streptogramin lyase